MRPRNAEAEPAHRAPVAGHRLRPAKGAATSHRARAELVAELVKAVAVP